MSKNNHELVSRNQKKMEEAKLAVLNTAEYKRGVPSALGVCCQLEKCGKPLSRPRDLLLHIRATHRENHRLYCIVCEVFFPRISDLVQHHFYIHNVPECSDSSHFTTAKYDKKEKPLAFNAKK